MKQKQTHRFREQVDVCLMGGEFGGGVKKMKELRNTNWQYEIFIGM